jgi:hypothetical protein
LVSTTSAIAAESTGIVVDAGSLPVEYPEVATLV